MLIDFHTHIFPDKIAQRTIEVLKGGIKEISGFDAENYHDGTLSGLRSSMKENGVDISVVMPIATKTTQCESINRFAMSVQSEDVVSFAGIHPMQDDYERVLEEIAESGFIGIKLHPEFQRVYIDSPEAVRVIKKAEELGLYTVIHAGKDVGLPPPVHAPVQRIAGLLDKISGDRFIAAHMGGFWQWDEVEKYLVGSSLYMDTAAVSKFIDKEQYRRIIKNHGAEKILFASDNPWEKPSDTFDCIVSLGLDKTEMDLITHKNALKILKKSIKSIEK